MHGLAGDADNPTLSPRTILLFRRRSVWRAGGRVLTVAVGLATAALFGQKDPVSTRPDGDD